MDAVMLDTKFTLSVAAFVAKSTQEFCKAKTPGTEEVLSK